MALGWEVFEILKISERKTGSRDLKTMGIIKML